MNTVVGKCHCGAVVFEVDLDNGLGDLRRCNCSLCRRKGAIMAGVALARRRHELLPEAAPAVRRRAGEIAR